MLDELITRRYAEWLEAERAKEEEANRAIRDQIRQIQHDFKACVCREFQHETIDAMRELKTTVGFNALSNAAYAELEYRGYRFQIHQDTARPSNKGGWLIGVYLVDSGTELTPVPFHWCKAGELELALLANMGYVLDPDR